MHKMILIVNPRAGQGRAGAQWPLLQALVADTRGARLLQTKRQGEASDIARRAARDRCDLVAVAGGDGTVNEVLNGLMSSGKTAADRPILGIIPLGSANDLARGLGLNGTVADGYRRILAARSRPIDVGCIRNAVGRQRHFGFSTGLGYVGAVAAERFKVRRVRGRWLYLWAGLRALCRYEPRAPILVGYGRRAPEWRRLMFLSINNAGSVGGFPLTPAATMDDGLLDVLTVRYVPRARRPFLLFLAWAGKHLDAPECRIERTDRIEVTARGPLPVHVDGELYHDMRQGGRLQVRLFPHALNVAL